MMGVYFRAGFFVCLGVLPAFTGLYGSVAGAEAYHVVLSGSGGTPAYEQQYRAWGMRLQSALVERLGNPSDRVYHLAEKLSDSDSEIWGISLDTIRELFADLSLRVTESDDLYVYLIGHGSYIKKESKFLIPGQDLKAEELDRLLDTVRSRRTIVLNGTSSSAGFINVLSGEGRVICTATKSVVEVNATEFMRFFIESIEEGGADRDHDERISFLEACQQAADLTATWYLGESLLATEHPILDDNGDGLGSRLPLSDPGGFALFGVAISEVSRDDGALAASCYLKDYSFDENIPREVVGAYLDTLSEIEALKRRKAALDEAEYYAELERLLIQAARANRAIRQESKALSTDS